MDPLSITVSVTSLIAICLKVTLSLKKLRDGAQIVYVKVKGLLIEVGNFTQTMNFIQETLGDNHFQQAFSLTGHISDHWTSISVCIGNALRTLESLHASIEGVDKNVRFLDSVRKQLRLKEASDEIAVYQQQIRSYRDIIQLSIQTAILWNQVSFRESATGILPGLDELSTMIRRLGTEMNQRITTLEHMVESPSREEELRNMQNLRNCVQTSAYVVSSASTTLGKSDTSSVIAPSDYWDLHLTSVTIAIIVRSFCVNNWYWA